VAFLVKAPAQHARAVRVNITLPEDVLAEVDKAAGRQGLSRSAFLARAARRAMNDAA
jgi:metal-responsive CopG/Arc/MetJ family transcriptional regulator